MDAAASLAEPVSLRDLRGAQGSYSSNPVGSMGQSQNELGKYMARALSLTPANESESQWKIVIIRGGKTDSQLFPLPKGYGLPNEGKSQ